MLPHQYYFGDEPVLMDDCRSSQIKCRVVRTLLAQPTVSADETIPPTILVRGLMQPRSRWRGAGPLGHLFPPWARSGQRDILLYGFIHHDSSADVDQEISTAGGPLKVLFVEWGS